MKLNIEQLEARLQALIEVKLVSVLPGFKLEDLVVQKFASAMKNNLVEDEDGNKIAPDVFTLVTHPKSVERWQEPKLLDTLLNALMTVAEEASLRFSVQPTISIMQNPDQEINVVDVVASRQVEKAEETRGMTPASDEKQPAEIKKGAFPQKAFLIVDGVKVFPLSKSVINIGRRLDNHLVIDDPRISRNHAQLRAIKGRFVIFDLNSTGGTFVNGKRTSQSVMYPGDVISLAGVPLVFGQDNPPPRPDLQDTDPLNSDASTNRPTAFLDRDTGQFEDDEDKDLE